MHRITCKHGAGRDDLSSGLKVSDLREKRAEFGLSTQGNKEILRERLAGFLDAEGSNDHDFLTEIRRMKLK